MVSGQWSVVSGQWSVVSGQWLVVSGQWSVVSGQWLVVSDLAVVWVGGVAEAVAEEVECKYGYEDGESRYQEPRGGGD